jgi:short subunit dehydrogenase-like uncharacterized protein
LGGRFICGMMAPMRSKRVRAPARRSPAAARRYDVVLYGATGFVGQQTVAYLAAHGGGLRWALGGRSAGRLEAVRGDAEAGIVVADGADRAALDTLAAQARVVLSTAGPFALHGGELVAACVRQKAHYVDITGETPWVRQLIDRHHAQAALDGTCIVPCCGFDSVPSDLGAWLVVQALRERDDENCVDVKACFSMRGGLNGGTIASLLNVVESGHRRELADPFLLNPPDTRPADPQAHADPLAPHRDDEFDAWVGPFVMGPINTRVVRRSAALLGYGDRFHYQEYMRFGRGAAAALAAAGASLGMLSGQAALASWPLRRLAAALAPAPGSGPSERQMDGGSFRCELVGTGERGSVVRGRIAGRGDPGNRATTRFVCEAALLLAEGGGQGGGVLTPASALGGPYADRLRAAGMTVEL